MTEFTKGQVKEENEETEFELVSFNDLFATLKGGAKLWTEIIKAVEEDVKIDNLEKRKGITSDRREGIEKIANLINENLDEKRKIDTKAFESKDIQDMYSFLKKEVDNVRIFKTGKTSSQKLLGVAKMSGRFVGGLFAQSLHIVGDSLKLAGGLVHLTPAAYILNRAPVISKKETVPIGKGYGKVRKNLIEILGNAINEGALYIYNKSNAPIISKAYYNLPKQNVIQRNLIQMNDASSILKRAEAFIMNNIPRNVSLAAKNIGKNGKKSGVSR